MPDINDLGTQAGSGSSPIYQIEQTGPVSPPSSGTVDDLQVDTQSRSKQEIESVVANAAFPILSTPINVSSSSNGNGVGEVSFGAKIFQQIEDIKMSILDGWSKNLKEIAERDERDRNSPQFKAMLDRQTSQYLAELARLSPAASINAAISSPEFARAIQQLSPAEKTNLTENTRAYATISGVESYSAQNGAAAIGMLAMMGGIGGVAAIETVVQGNALVTSVQDIAGAMVTTAQSIVPGATEAFAANTNAMLIMMGGFFSQNVLQFSYAETVKEAAKKNHPPKGLDVAQNFAKNTISLVSDPGFSAFIRNHVISKMFGSEKLTEAQKDQLTSLVKIVLLGTAIGVMSKTEMGWINPTQFKDIVEGRVNIEGHDIRHTLIAALIAESDLLDNAGSAVRARKDSVINALGNVLSSLNTKGKREVDENMMKTVDIFQKVGEFLDGNRPISAGTR